MNKYLNGRERARYSFCSSNNPSYNFSSVSGDGEEGGGELRLTGLRPYTRYTLVVQAYNQVGPGPLCEPLLTQTLEDGDYYKFFLKNLYLFILLSLLLLR